MFLSTVFTNFIPHIVQVFQDTSTVPTGIPEWLGLAVASGTITEVVKRITALTGYKISGKSAVLLSFIVTIGVVLGDLANGGTLVTIPDAYMGGNPFLWFAGVLLTAGKVTAAANAIYVFVYDKVFGSSADEPVSVALAAMSSGLPHWKIAKAFVSSTGGTYAVGEIVSKGTIGTATVNGVVHSEIQLANLGYIRPWA